MSDNPDFVPPEVIEAAKQRDYRFRHLDLGLRLEAALRTPDSPLYLLMSKLRDDADAAMREFAYANCGETVLIQGLQSRVFRIIHALDTFGQILDAGRAAEVAIREEDTAEALTDSEWDPSRRS